ncbi:class I SAM-dependent methyltransferase [Roseospira navarrensis]|uniref:Methyltransferase domain-containing protein n=1 Tax=Roseospira navarrensis TaxID=140058 RepID=A0A7X1ZAQ1_9PROT|nr:class I SAM-dependent methyltransferase [Roseospira navarrensis]MQX35099.1 methyltransferase domain-containing protein [Roseospira navarrensis]
MPPPEVHLKLTVPAPWITRFAALIRPGGAVLDVACGGGRHARWLVARGFALTLVDRDTDAVADLADRAEIVTADLEDGAPWPFAGRTFDAVMVTNYLHRPLFGPLVDAVAPGGVLLYQTFMLGNERFARPRNPDHLLRPGELLEAIAGRGLQVVAFQQGQQVSDSGQGQAVVQALCACRTDQPVALPPTDPPTEPSPGPPVTGSPN